MDMKELLITLRDIHFKCFLVGFIFLVIAALIYLPCRCAIANIYQSFFGLSAEIYYKMWIFFVGIIKTILIFLFLTPAIACHWALKCHESKLENKD